MAQYKLKAPVGNIIIPKEVMAEEELRSFIFQLVQDPDQAETWKEKASKDPIKDLVEYLKRAGFSVEII